MQPCIDASVLSGVYCECTVCRIFGQCVCGKTTQHMFIPTLTYPATVGAAAALVTLCWEGWHGWISADTS